MSASGFPRTVAAHDRSFPHAPRVTPGETVREVRDDPKNPGWFHGVAADGTEGYFPSGWFRREEDGATATAMRDYDAAELTVEAGVPVSVLAVESTWTLVRTLDGRQGWIPTPCVSASPTVGGILRAIGGTPLIALRRIVPRNGARVLVKLESHNPTGSMKDRMALSVIDHGAATGAPSGRGEVVEYTGGSTGTSLALVCAARGVPITLVSSDAFSREKRDHMRALGATLIEIPSHGGGTTRELIRAMMARAAELAAQPGWYYADQFHNPAAAAGYAPLAEELWQQSGGRIDAFVQSVGTAQCITGVARVLRKKRPGVRIVAVEPAESAVLSGGAPGAHHIEGVGPGFIPPVWEDGVADRIETVSTEAAQQMARRLAREEAVFAGTSAGANVVAALRVAERLAPDATVVTLICDSGLKYLSTDLFSTPPRRADPRA